MTTAMPRPIAGTTAMVTGANRGLGQAFVRVVWPYTALFTSPRLLNSDNVLLTLSGMKIAAPRRPPRRCCADEHEGNLDIRIGTA